MIDFESKIQIIELQTWMDGGSITLICNNVSNQEFEIEFVQNVIWNIHESQNIPGRIYLNKKLVDQRSDLEVKIIKAIIGSTFKTEDLYDQQIVNEMLDYIRSEEYLTNQEKIKVERI